MHPKYRHALPQRDGGIFLTDAGLETVLIFQDGIALPCFAAFDLLKSAEGERRRTGYFAEYARLAREQGTGLILESATWRASPDWGTRLGYDAAGLAEMNRRAIDVLLNVRAEYETPNSPMPISGNIGPRAEAFDPEQVMSPAEAEAYHQAQIA